MSQTDTFHIPNLTGPQFRALLNQILIALADQNSGSTEPQNPFAGMVWLDTSTATPVFKLRNAANTGWVKIFTAETPPTKAQIGLSNVPNYSATSSLTDSSMTKFLLAAAGKNLQDNKLGKSSQAYDSARLGNKLANQYVLISGTYSNLRAQATTKGDVSLGNVANYGITNSITSNNSSLYLSAKGGYDLNQKKVDKTLTINGKPLSGNITLTAANVGALPSSGGNLSGSVNYTPDTGDIIRLDGKTLLRRISANGGVSFGCDDALIMGCGEARQTLQDNVSATAEELHLGSDGSIKLYTNLQSSWNNRKLFEFEKDGGFLPGNVAKTRKNLDVPKKGAGRVIGEICYFSFDTPPSGFFALDGSTVVNGVNDFPALAASGSRFITVSGNDIILKNAPDFLRGKGSSLRNIGDFNSDTVNSSWLPTTAARHVSGGGYHRTSFLSDFYGSPNESPVKHLPTASETAPRSHTVLICLFHGVI